MRSSFGMKVGLVSLFSCLALLLGLLSSTGVASAHTANTLQSAHISSIALADDQRRENFEHEGMLDPSSDSPTNSCPAGTVSTVTFDKGEAPNNGCTDPSNGSSTTGGTDWPYFNDWPTNSGGTIHYQHDDHGRLR